MTYSLTQFGGIVLRDADGAMIPADPANGDWQAFLAWQAAGNTPTPYAAPPSPVPGEVTNWQARAALSDQPATDGKSASLLAQVDAAVQGSGNAKLIAAWEYGNTFLRGSSFVATMAAALGLSAAQVDALFVAADAET